MFVKKIMSPDLSGSIKSYIEEVTRDVGETLELTKRPKECLFYFMDGCGVMSIYDPIPGEDVCEIQQDTMVWITPEIKHEIKNGGNYPLGYLCFSAWIE